MRKSAGIDTRKRARAGYARCSRIPEFISGAGVERSGSAGRFPPAVGSTLQMRGAGHVALTHHLEGSYRAADGGDAGCLDGVTDNYIADRLFRQIVGDWFRARDGRKRSDRDRSWCAGHHIERLIVRMTKAQGYNSSVQQRFAKLRREKAGRIALRRHYRKSIVCRDVDISDRQLLPGIAVAHND